MDILITDLTEFYNKWLNRHELPPKDANELLADFHFGTYDDTHKDTAYYTRWLTGFIVMWDTTEKFLEKRG